jgi:hypothetical protein
VIFRPSSGLARGAAAGCRSSNDAEFRRKPPISAATLVPAHDYEAWPDRGYWVLVMRYRDDDGHIRFQFVGRDGRLRKTNNIQAKTRAPERQQITYPDYLEAELKPPASRKPEPQRRNPQERPVAHAISDRGDASVRRHRRVNVEAMRQ